MKYELAFIINPTVPETEHQKLYQEIAGYIVGSQAEVVGQPFFMGRKKLAYPIKKQKHGFYVFLEFNSENQAGLKELDTKLKHHVGILRHLIIKKDKAATGPLVDANSFNEKPAHNEPRSQRRNNNMMPRRNNRPASRQVAKTVTVERTDADKLIGLGEIDRKLDEILTQDPKLD